MPASSHRPVRLISTQAELAGAVPLLESVASAAGDVPALLLLAQDAGGNWPQPGGGNTARLWELLASVSAVDVAGGRVFEPHMDAQAILAQVGMDQTGQAQTGNYQPRLDPEGPVPAGLVPTDVPTDVPAGRAGAWGVFAAEGPGLRLDAKTGDTGILLSGSKPWCSLAPLLDRAVITAHAETGGRAAFAVDLRHPGVTCEEPVWVARGLREIPSGTVHFSQVPAQQLGSGGWYFSRPGFAWGGMGVAACWLGGAVGVARDYKDSLAAAAQSGREPDQIALAALGETDRILTASLQYLARTAALIDDGQLSNHGSLFAGEDALEAGSHSTVERTAWSEALRVRGTIAAAVERVLSLVSRNRGPAPLAFDEPYAKRMADLALYVRQHHGMRDDAQLGSLTLKGEYLW